MINDLDLEGFVNGAIARGRITFGDVRRLQRDYLPGGIETRAQAESLAALADSAAHADRSWKQWFTATLAAFATKGAEGDAAARDETVAWLERLSEKPGFARRTGRKIARQLRRGAEPAETTVLAAEAESVDAVVQEPAAIPAVQHDAPDETARRKRTRAAKRSKIVVRRARPTRARPQPKRDAMPFAMMPTPWVWSPLMGAQQLQVQLAAPVR